MKNSAADESRCAHLFTELLMRSFSLPRRHVANALGKIPSLALPVAVAALAAGAAYAGADTTFSPALTKFTGST